MEKPKTHSSTPEPPRVEILTLGWNVALGRPPRVEVCDLPVTFTPPVALTVRIMPPGIRVRSFYFGDPDVLCRVTEKKKRPVPAPSGKPFSSADIPGDSSQDAVSAALAALLAPATHVVEPEPLTPEMGFLSQMSEIFTQGAAGTMSVAENLPLFGLGPGATADETPEVPPVSADFVGILPETPGVLHTPEPHAPQAPPEVFPDVQTVAQPEPVLETEPEVAAAVMPDDLLPDGLSLDEEFPGGDANPAENTLPPWSLGEAQEETPKEETSGELVEEFPDEIPADDEETEEDAAAPAYPPVRIQPPRDLIKLEDRLRYLLQPPLTQLYSDNNLHFPFEPFHYQWEGVSFLYSRTAAILADEMGLGKTMQAITTIRLLLRSGDLRNVLLICPKPLVTNWKREFEVWAPEIPLMIIEGDQARRAWQWQLMDVPVKIANYELLNRDREFFAPQDMPPVPFDLVILDESQRIKNQNSATSVAARAISRGRNWALTGTPIENSTDDLIGIFEFLSPGYLNHEMKPSAMSRAIGDYVLRRTKDLVLKDMPPRLYRDADLSMSPEQESTYKMAESQGALRLTEMGDSASIQHVFELVLRLKQICNFDPCTGESPKLQRLEADLEEVAASGRKAIVFSQWTETIFRLRKSLERFGPLEYHGKIPSAKRDGVIEEFRHSSDKHVLLMSYGAGSVGLNLQFCNYVFLFDRWWNPAVEDQAINRAHRIGVNGAVTITRFLMQGTIEERIDRVLQEKRELFEAIICGAEAPRQKLGLTQNELFGLFNLKSPKGPIKLGG